VCNNASGWAARDIEVSFYYYDRDSLRWSTYSNTTVYEVRAGTCEAFSHILITIFPVSRVGIDEVTWRWVRE
jgi:hypothetical protein